MAFASEFHPLFHTHELQLRSKINPFILGGNPPRRPPPLPKPENPTEAWTKKANAFAAYYLVLFRPFNEDVKGGGLLPGYVKLPVCALGGALHIVFNLIYAVFKIHFVYGYMIYI
jgi:hypothetical protein